MEQRFSTKRWMSILVVFAMLIASFSVFAMSATAEATNIAKGKSYTTVTPLGGYNANLTDGVAGGAIAYSGDKWFAFSNNNGVGATQPNGNAPERVADVVIDLAGSFDISEVKVAFVQNDGSGISMPSAVKVYLSADGEAWGEAIAIAVPAIEDTTKDVAFYVEGDVVGTASFVKVEIALGAKMFVFFNEIEVYGEAAADESEPEVSEPETSEPEVSEPEVSEPEVSEPETSEPEVSEPEVSEPETSEPETSEPEVSEPEVSEPETSEPETSEPEERVNIAFEKDYEAKIYGSYTADLTDGVAATNIAYNSPNWFAFYYNQYAEASVINAPGKVGTVVIDLAGSFDITGVKINTVQNDASGIAIPVAVKVYLSDDGETYGEAIELALPALEDTTKDVAFAIEDDVVGTASFIKFEFVLGEKAFVFFNEIEVYGTEAEADEPEVSDPEVSEPETSEPETSDPEVSEPETSDPETSDPEVSEPETSEPETSDPEVSEPETEAVLGDVDGDDDVDATDYVLVKRAVLKTYELSEEQFAVADIDGDGDVDVTDYVLVKRMVLGTYVADNGSDEDTDYPETSEPEVSEPEVSEPETSDDPEVSEPETSDDPEVSEPETSDDPEVSEPETSDDPEVSEPETSDDPEVSEPETSEPETSEPVEATNVALNKEFSTVDPLSGYNANLTDGVVADKMAYSGDKWFAFSNNNGVGATQPNGNAPDRVADVVIDLDGSFDISEVKVAFVQNEGSGIAIPSAVKVYLSDDGETWGEAIALTIPAIEDTTKDNVFYIEGEVIGTASFVKVEIALGEKTFVFFNEIEVYGVTA